ncbi:S41 family peptidase [Calidithermus timidus]|jgi:carboxyl-terminal processing protease|uniref:S41 family peptidase n=1 Tax=Calidithermus timidus TaxID=307124 RepID=UPI0003735C14|nr:S41 family peptidase [Calidithermus timidus]
MRLRALILAALLALGTGLTHPAGDLLQEALRLLETHYFGYAQPDFKVLGERYGRELERLCASNLECGFEVGRSVVARLVRDIGDGHTYFLSPERYKQSLDRFAGRVDPTPIYGISMVGFFDGRVLIGDVRPQSAADVAGVRPFDRVVAVGGESLKSLEDFRNRINTDQPVRLSLLRGVQGAEQRLELTLRRQPYSLPVLPLLYAPSDAPQGVFVLRIPDFAAYKQVGPRVHALVREAEGKGAKAIVVDLRGNSGGEETECESAPGAFVDAFSFEMRSKTATVPFGYADGAVLGNDPKDPNPPYRLEQPARFGGKVAVLIDGSTASCGEIMAYVLKEFGQVPLIGQRTAGVMNTATEFWPLPDGSAIAITYVRTLKAGGEPLPEFVTPDVEMPYEPEVIARTGRDPMLEKALEVLGVK